jgi:hypothetical protein
MVGMGPGLRREDDEIRYAGHGATPGGCYPPEFSNSRTRP